jgi:hypothetical protein
MEEKRGIVPFFVGGLGNQMFQIAAAFCVGFHNRCPVYIPLITNNNNPHRKDLQYSETIFKHFGLIFNLENDSPQLKQLLTHYKYESHKGHTLYAPYKAWDPKEVAPGTIMTSYYQYYPALEPREYEIRCLFLEGIRSYIDKLAHLNIDEKTTAFVHVRRGDYLINKELNALTPQYYFITLNLILKVLPYITKIYVISDDMEWVKSQIIFKSNVIEFFESKDELECMALMSLCKAGAICANSTFSWWGAFLGAHSIRAPVFVPEHWVKNNTNDLQNLFPAEWVKMGYNRDYYSDTYISDLLSMSKGIIPITLGGLGNQMFNMAAGYVAHRHTGSPLYICRLLPNENVHNTSLHDYRKSIFKYLGKHIQYTHKDIDITAALHGFSYDIQIIAKAFAEWYPEKISSKTIMSSYYQFYPPIEKFEHEIRDIFVRGLEEIRSKFPDYSKSAFLHVRRGDYLKYQDIHYIQPLSYYEKAIEKLMSMKQVDQILVFSDDLEWIKSQDLFKNPLMKIMELDDELDTLACMSLCKAGAICANSTFSWWGAFLGAHGARSPVFVPERWIGNEQPVKLFPDEWIII